MINTFFRFRTLTAALATFAISFVGITRAQTDKEHFRIAGIVASQSNPKTSQAALPAERAALIHMWEEEKLAYEVYGLLSQKWGERPFGNIRRAEQMHMSLVTTLLEQFQIPDPAATSKPGEFVDKELQKLYKEFVKKGSSSRAAALHVGATIEDLDIYNLSRQLGQIKNPEIRRVIDLLRDGSVKHLRAFSRNLSNSGKAYTPQYISAAEFQKIIAGG